MARTFGETKNCAGCRYWSEMIARAGGGTDNPRGDVEAMCLNATSPRSGNYTVERDTCEKWATGDLGAVDDPPNYGEATRALYAAREATGPAAKAQCPSCGADVDSIFDHIDQDCEHP